MITLEDLKNAEVEHMYWRDKTWKKVDFGSGVFSEHSEFWHGLSDYRFLVNGEAFEVKEIARTGGMDEGSHASVVFRVGDSFFKKTGYYASHYGYDWDGPLTQVHPKEKTIVVYE